MQATTPATTRRLPGARGPAGRARGCQRYKPFNQATYIDLAENPTSAPQAIHQGLSLGREPLLEFLHAWQDIGIDQLMINFKHSRRPVSEVIAEFDEDVLPYFPAGTASRVAC